MDLDVVFVEDKLVVPTNDNNQVSYGKTRKVERCNRLGLMMIKRAILDTIRDCVPSCDMAKEFLAAVRQKFKDQIKQRLKIL